MNSASNRVVKRGELYWVDWSPGRGSEQTGRRPGLIVQENAASSNHSYPLTIVAAVSTKGRAVSSCIKVEPSERNGLSSTSYVKCEQIQTVSKARLGRMIGELEADDLNQVSDALKQVFALD